MKYDYDIIIIGGGASGVGVAYEASKKGYKILLVDKFNFASQTSDNSLRIIHGGFRYLQSLDILRSIESIKAQKDLVDEFPQIVHSLKCAMPLNKFGLKSKIPVMFGSLFYGFLLKLLGSNVKSPKVVSNKVFENDFPLLKGEAKYGALEWNDAILSDNQKLMHEHVNDIINNGGEARENSSVRKIKKEKSGYRVFLESKEITSKVVVNTAGAWINKFEFENIEPSFKNVLWTKAANILIPKKQDLKNAFGISSSEGRLYFVVPREDCISVGTFYYPLKCEDKSKELSDAELGDAIFGFNKTVPQLSFNKDEIIKIESGILPAESFSNGEVSLYGSEKIVDTDGYVEVLSTKYTTFREQGKKIVKLCSKHL